MAKKKKKLNFYSTNPDFEYHEEDNFFEETLEPSEQVLRVLRDRKGRKGKEVTLVTGFEGQENDLKTLGKTLKAYCGVGGSVKDGEIILQGNQIDKALQFLKKEGYTKTKRVGG